MNKKIMAVVSGALLIAMASPSFAQDLTSVSVAGTGNVFSLMGLLFAGSSVVGFFLCIVGILYFKKDRQQPNQGHAATGMQYLGVGVGLLAVTFVINVIINSFGGEGHSDPEGRLSDHGWTSGG